MIRKIILAFILLFVLTWIIFAHFAKSKLISLINNSQTDNIKIYYKDINISGFPFDWKIKFTSPKLTIIDQDSSQEIASDYLTFSFNYKLSKAKLDFGKLLFYNTENDEEPIKYTLHAQEDIVFFIDFTDLLYKINVSNSLTKIIKNIEFSNPSIVTFVTNGNEIFDLTRINVKLNSKMMDITQTISLKLSGCYKSSSNDRVINNADCVLDANYIVSDNSNAAKNNNFDYKIQLLNAKVNLNNSSLDLKGSVALSSNNSPQGKISIELVDYANFIDFLLPDDFIFSKSDAKDFIAKAAAVELNNEVTNKINFDLEFSNKTISLGRLNLSEQINN